ncbi:hypothetical protein F4780DRAFT_451972 [Xylariomycetidae sp. FL0641]|nr:hypothetical protein F4780DRAFT_451972 [Xylariomycetidae sp. FL0641]
MLAASDRAHESRAIVTHGWTVVDWTSVGVPGAWVQACLTTCCGREPQCLSTLRGTAYSMPCPCPPAWQSSIRARIATRVAPRGPRPRAPRSYTAPSYIYTSTAQNNPQVRGRRDQPEIPFPVALKHYRKRTGNARPSSSGIWQAISCYGLSALLLYGRSISAVPSSQGAASPVRDLLVSCGTIYNLHLERRASRARKGNLYLAVYNTAHIQEKGRYLAWHTQKLLVPAVGTGLSPVVYAEIPNTSRFYSSFLPLPLG